MDSGSCFRIVLAKKSTAGALFAAGKGRSGLVGMPGSKPKLDAPKRVPPGEISYGGFARENAQKEVKSWNAKSESERKAEVASLGKGVPPIEADFEEKMRRGDA